jgi:tripartite-type tricarboxylate transporter receptor subunit TctC
MKRFSTWGAGALAALAMTALASVSAQAQAPAYPSKPIKIIVPYAAGGGVDLLSRLLSQDLSERLQTPVVIDNRPGASTFIGAEMLARSAPDGYTLMNSAASTFAINQALYNKLPYDPANDFAPVSLLGRFPLMLVVAKDYPAKSVKELVDMAKAKPRSLDFASAGIGSTHHLAMELFLQRAGIEGVHVPYKGAGPALQDLIGGRVPAMFLDVTVAREPLKGGLIRALAIATPARVSDLPDVPTISESGYPGFEASAWNGVVAPKGTPPEIIDKLNTAFGEALKSPATVSKLNAAGIEPAHDTPAEFGAYIKSEQEKWGTVIRNAKITVDQPQ